MSSILTNTSAMVALQTLKGINSSLAKTQDEISTGKSIGSAKDNAAIWAISKVMESDARAFKTISDNLSLGESTVSVARQAAETVTDLLADMRDTIIAGQEKNVDRAKLQTDIESLTKQIEAVVSAAQFNGLNLLNGTAGDFVEVLGSLDRASNGNVTAGTIAVNTSDLTTTATPKSAVIGALSATNLVASDGTDDGEVTFDIVHDSTGAAAVAFQVGDTVTVAVGNKAVTYTVTAADLDDADDDVVSENIAVNISAAVEALGIEGVTADGTDGTVTITNTSEEEYGVVVRFDNANLSALTDLDVTSDTGAAMALSRIEALMSKAIDSAAAFGSVQSRIEIQNTFVQKLADALTTGVGALVDADMEEASARLTALQTQQQLAIQSLSIANQAPQNILALFR